MEPIQIRKSDRNLKTAGSWYAVIGIFWLVLYFVIAPFASEMAKHPKGGLDLLFWWNLEAKGFTWSYLVYALGFLVLSILFFYYSMDTRPLLIIDDVELTIYSWYFTTCLKWTQVHSVKFWDSQKQKRTFPPTWNGSKSLITIRLNAAPKWFQFNRHLNRIFFGGDFVIVQQIVTVHPGFIATEISRRFPSVYGLE